jgi:hypothetical protein
MNKKKNIKEGSVKKINANSKLKNKSFKKTKNQWLNDKRNRQILWTIVLMTSIIAIIILVPLIKHNFIDKFVYSKLDFQKTRLGDMVFYSTYLPVADSSGQKIIGTFSINFRNDPRKLESIPVDMKSEFITFNKKDVVYVSIGDMNRNCLEGTAATLTLAGFLRQFAQMNVSAGMSNEQTANENNFPYITCENSKNNTVIKIIEGDKTEIRQINSNCYELEYKECEVMKVSEKFIIEIIKGYMKDFTREDSILDLLR